MTRQSRGSVPPLIPIAFLIVAVALSVAGGHALSQSSAESGLKAAERDCVQAVLPLAGGSSRSEPRSIDLTKDSDGTWYGGGTLTVLDPVDGSTRVQPYNCTVYPDSGGSVVQISGIDPQYFGIGPTRLDGSLGSTAGAPSSLELAT